ncbi:MAG: CCA tRNA nucleotidyltransferase [Phormidesmis sp.]
MSLFSPETWPFSLDMLPDSAYLVGGSVRDRLLNRQSGYLDLDFVLPGKAIETAAAIARIHQAGFVVLDQARQIARVVFEQATVDFAQQQGDSLEADLHRRDFTINAIAYHPHDQRLIDPLGGEADIASKTIRMVSYHNLLADPLRLMRAYRQAAQLGFGLDTDTQTAIGELAPQLTQVSIERIRSELDALLSTPNASQQLTPILKHQLLQFCLPCFNAERIAQVAAIETAIASLKAALPDYAESLYHWEKPVPVGSYRSWIKAAKLSRLVCANLDLAQTELTALKYSRSEARIIRTMLTLQPDIAAMRSGPLSRSRQFFLFKTAGESFPALSLLALAQGVKITVLQPLIERFLNPDDEVAHSQALVTGSVLIKQLGIPPGPKIGTLLKAVEIAQAEGKIREPEAAIAWVKQIEKD